MLVHELRLSIAAQEYAEVVKPGDHPLQLDPVDQENRLSAAIVVLPCFYIASLSRPAFGDESPVVTA
jgi:hypothetical protein